MIITEHLDGFPFLTVMSDSAMGVFVHRALRFQTVS